MFEIFIKLRQMDARMTNLGKLIMKGWDLHESEIGQLKKRIARLEQERRIAILSGEKKANVG